MNEPSHTPSGSTSSSRTETDIEIEKIDYVDPQRCLKLRTQSSKPEEGGREEERDQGMEKQNRMEDDDGIPVKRIHGPADLDRFLDSIALDRILQVLLNISNRIARFGIIEKDAQVEYLKNLLNSSPQARAVISILDRLDHWITEIPLDPSPQRFGNKAFKIWGQRLESEAEHLHTHTQVITDYHKPIHTELLHHFKTSFGSFGRLDYGTGHELSFLGYLSILHLTRILNNQDLLLTGLIIYQKYFNLCRRLQKVYNLEPAGSKGVYGLDDFFHVVYIFGSAQLLYHPTIKPCSILDEKFVSRINELKSSEGEERLNESSIDFLSREGIRRSLFFESVQNTLLLKSQPAPRVKMTRTGDVDGRGEEKEEGQNRTTFLDHSPILLNLATNVKGWPKIYSGLIKMMKGEIFSKVPVMQHFWIAGTHAVLPWLPRHLSSASDSGSDRPVEEPDLDYVDHYRKLK
ncbi:hypothetical protein MJO29_015948 [Puccinia striiformis f. sp. tritici]|uniref:Serine/threonine-protein phosphatase 2A activator n=1 Tax=Puccinia striiformis f. sp. tritici PST-78 TaxID=1165861 RepID=A0A0L0V4B2_9BASI|nr:hypothetical protein Pst134EA_030216 [Puccinia striiformis f. sp. tritici]KAH9446294.1 hypothetical protein Pst134EA_030216 [Puccinia striiformis f. sp. tritici]KAI7934685.1 hypothetical protein MJO29_015948 [Puccinia striiformis f. sp. tritici]KNE94011.1 hypothetical protein PSTG_12678 [Puccinia striiformis f. sp. tritici PST-78]